MGDLGRYQRGQKAQLALLLPGVPDSAPIATVTEQATGDVVASYRLPMAGSLKFFLRRIMIDSRYVLGKFLVAYSYSIGGSPGTAGDELTVVAGGDSGGDVISLCAYDRPEARFVLAQTGNGRLVQGRNPYL